MSISDSNLTQHEEQFSTDSNLTKMFLENITRNLSCILLENAFDIIHSGIQVYDPYLIQENVEKKQHKINFTKKIQAISLRSKSTRNLNIRHSSFTNFMKSSNLATSKFEPESSEPNGFDTYIYDNLQRSRSRPKLNKVNEKRRKKSYEPNYSKSVLKDVRNVKSNNPNKSLRKSSKKSTHSRRSQAKLNKFASLTPNKYSNIYNISYTFLYIKNSYIKDTE